ncbi:FeoA family protein [Synechococcus sp. CS-603]|uniref:FeoA family protein n=1 Tax=Synechococcus sp. CS-603 TaxID=2847981 RepID=UPI00223B4E2D|nr:FeoA family protein [Synechococcus sp. CS-603]MCT0201676.1 ferrous iron transport protein A [Synechococcus sp. CS-603]MCT4363821.1 ferrous iron transport protein A [Candidatus Regnicoccus frigidus MAG-AL1]
MTEVLRPLAVVPTGETVWLRSLPEQPALQARLRAMGVRPGVALQVLRRGYPGGLLHLRAGLMEFMLRRREAAQMDTASLPDPAISPAPAAGLIDTAEQPSARPGPTTSPVTTE